MELGGKRIAVLVETDYQDLEVWYPLLRMKEAGAEVTVVGSGTQEDYKGKYGYPITVDTNAASVKAEDFDAVVIPGGWAPDRLRMHEPVLNLVRAMFDQGKVVAAICHAGSVLVSAGILEGKTATAYRAVKDDMVLAGCHFEDAEVVIDGNLITSRTPDDLPAFCRAIIESLIQAPVAG